MKKEKNEAHSYIPELKELYRGGKITRREFLQTATLLGMSLASASTFLTACARATPTPTEAPPTEAPTEAPPTEAPTEMPAFDWKRYAGTEITALFTNVPTGRFFCKRAADFEALSGIKVDCQILETAAMRDKQNVEFAAGSSSIDVWHSMPTMEGQKYLRAGWYEPIQPYLDNPALTMPDFDLADFGNLQLATLGGQLVGLPLWTEVPMLYYNKELLEQGGVAVPKTMDELEAAAKKLHQPAKEIYGWAMRGSSYFNTGCYSSILFSMGGEWTDGKGHATLNSPQAIAALDWYGRMLRLYGPPSPETLDYARASDLFAAGKAAFFYDTSAFIQGFLDPTKSKIVGKWDITSWPAGAAGSHPYCAGWFITIGKFSEKKEAAWLYCQFNTTKEADLLLAVEAGAGPARKSTLERAEYKESIAKTMPSRIDILRHAMEHGRPDMFPPVETVTEARQIYGDAMVAAILGEDVKAVSEEANREIQALLDRERGG